jgi:hypothetical protein
MKLDYIHNINVHGDNIVRLYDFDMAQAEKFRNALHQIIIINKTDLKLSSINFIESRNCRLTLRIATEDLGISTTDQVNFFCDLTPGGYSQMVTLLAPFCKRETKGYQYLYDVDSSTDFLFSPAGTW